MIVSALGDNIFLLGFSHSEVKRSMLLVLVVICIILVATGVLRCHVMVGWVLIVVGVFLGLNGGGLVVNMTFVSSGVFGLGMNFSVMLRVVRSLSNMYLVSMFGWDVVSHMNVLSRVCIGGGLSILVMCFHSLVLDDRD